MELKSTVAHDAIIGQRRDLGYPAPRELAHISLAHVGPGVDDLIRFYQVVLNMRLVFRWVYPNFEFIALSFDNENHRLGIVNLLAPPPGMPAPAPDMPEPRSLPQRPCRMEHSSWFYHSFADILLTAERVHQELGMWPRTARHQEGGITIDYNDPDGNRVELLCESRSQAEILFDLQALVGETAGTGTRTFDTTYTGFNMEKMIGLWRAGVDEALLLDKDYCVKLVAEGNL